MKNESRGSVFTLKYQSLRNWELYEFPLTLNLLSRAEPGSCLCFPVLIP